MQAERIEHRNIRVDNDVTLHVAIAGKGPLVVLLHGFPDFWFSYRYQIDALVDAGFRVVVPDQRGYNTSSKPSSIDGYGLVNLASDVRKLIAELGETKAHIVGHDWGGAVAWAVAMAHPEIVSRLVILNSPHPERMLAALKRPRQLLRSWYMFVFQLPRIPEAILRRGDFAVLAKAIKNEPSRPGAVSDDDIAQYREAWSQAGAIEGMLAWYRAMFRKDLKIRMKRVEAKVLVLWGDGDPHLGTEVATPLEKLVPNARVEMVRGASHWVHVDAPEIVNREMIAFLKGEA